jgi:hypothetical protein
MDLLILLLEPFLPEIAAKLAGKNTVPLRKRLLRSGLFFLLIALLFVLWTLFTHLVLNSLPLNQFDSFDIKIYMAWLFGATGIGLLIILLFQKSNK